MEHVNIHEAKTHLSRLLARVQAGEEIVIARAGKPVAILSPFRDLPAGSRVFGGDEGLFQVPDDFDAPDPELIRLFEDGPVFPEP